MTKKTEQKKYKLTISVDKEPLEIVKNRLSEKISISTTHKYKGLEKAIVIILDAFERNYPLIHPEWVFFRIFGEPR